MNELIIFLFAFTAFCCYTFIGMTMITEYDHLTQKQKVFGYIVTFPFGILIKGMVLFWGSLGKD